ncbi:MAG: LytTR family DNA-binding domain-containing protein [Gemmatimonadales bacterium]
MLDETPTRKIRAIIVDDEPLGRDCVRLALQIDPEVEVVAECGDGESALRAIAEHRPDLIFLDVQMPKLSGFDVVDRVGAAHMPPVVFVSAFDAHAVRAFQVHALDYLLKPFDDQRFAEALAHAKAQLGLKALEAMRERLSGLMEEMEAEPVGDVELETSPSIASRFVVRRNDRLTLLKADEVDWFEGASNYVKLHVKNQEYRLRVSIRSLMERLDPAVFVRIHKSTVVNVDRIKEVQPWFGGDYVVILTDNRQLRVSRTFAHSLLRPIQ